jgi:hypothetical protein
MKTLKYISLILFITIFISACRLPSAFRKSSLKPPAFTSCSTPDANAIASCQYNPPVSPTVLPTEPITFQTELTQTDSQGAITVKITPENIEQPGDTLIFEVIMDTHSVDLSMDLAQLTTLTTDTGKTIQALKWDAPRGGHHVTGKLSFSTLLDGIDIITGVKGFTITIDNLDVPTRQFIWSLN